MRCRVPLLLCVLLVAALAVGAAPTSAQPDAEESHLVVELQDDGDAGWTVVAVVPLEDEDDRESFEAFGQEFEAGDHDLDLGVSAFERAAAEAAEETGRDMAIRSIDREAVVVNETVGGETVQHGELRVSFTWVAFARVENDGERLVVDDAFNTTTGTWLQGLGPDQTLTIESPPGYVPTTSPIGAKAGTLHWEGPQTFEPGYFTIVYRPTGLSTGFGYGLTTLLLAGAVISSGAALVLGLYLLWRRRDGSDAPSDDVPTPEAVEGPASGAGGNGAGAVAGADTDGGSGGAGAGSGAGSGTQTGATVTDGDAGAGAGAVADDGEPDLELLSDEERVEYLLEQNGGRMKQATIVTETGWSNAKVSQLLSSMEDDDRIDKLRIGRENLISLPGEDVTDIGGEADEE